METWRDILMSAAASDKRIVIRKVLLTKQGIPYANGRHELLYIASDACIGVQRAQGIEMPGECLQLQGRPQTLKFVTKEEKNTHNNLTNNKGDHWETVHFDGTQAVIVTPVADELQGAASWQELAGMAGVSIETIDQIRRTCVREKTRPIPFYFRGPKDTVSTVQNKRTTQVEVVSTKSDEREKIPEPAEPETAPAVVPVTPEGVYKEKATQYILAAANPGCSTAAPEPVEPVEPANNNGATEKTVLTDLNTSDDRRALRTLEALRQEAGAAEPPKGITAKAYLSDKVQALGKLQAEIEHLRESMMNHVIQIGDGAPPIIPVAKNVVCASLFRVADPTLIEDLNKIMYDCAKQCSEALVYAEERALEAMSAEADEMLRDWEPTAEEAAAVNAIKRARRDRAKVKAPRARRDKIAFYRLPKEGDHAIPSLEPHTVNESGHKIPAKKRAAATKGSRLATDETAAPRNRDRPGKGSKKGSKNSKPKGKEPIRARETPKPAKADKVPPKNPPAKNAAKPAPGKSKAPGQRKPQQQQLAPRGGQVRTAQPNPRKNNAPPQKPAAKNFPAAPRRPRVHSDVYQWQQVASRRQRPPRQYGPQGQHEPQGHQYQPRQQYHGQYYEGQAWQRDAPYYQRNY